MTERDDGSQREEPGFVSIEPLEVIVDSSGESIVSGIRYSDEDALNAFKSFVEKAGTGEITPSDSISSQLRQFFSSSRWNSRWEPEGPKPINLQKPPEDLSLN